MVGTIKNKVERFLEWGEEKTGTDIPYAAKGNFFLGIGTIISALSSFAIALAFGNFADPETYGTYRFVLSYYSILAVAGLSGFGPATVRAVARGFEGEFFKSFKVQALGSLAGSFISFGLSFYYFINQNQILGFGFLILGVALPFVESLALYNAFLTGRQEIKKLTKYDVIAQVIATLMLAGAIFLRLDVIGLLLVFFCGWTTVRLFFFLYIIKKYRPNKKTENTTTRLGTHLTLMGLLSNVASYLDRIVIFHFLGAIEVAIYSFAIAPAEQFKSFLKNINTLAMPRFSQRSEIELKNTMIKKMFLMGLIIAAAIAIYVPLAPIFFKTFLPKYMSSVLPSQIFIISLLGITATLPISAMKSLAKVRALYFSNIVSSIITIVLIITLTPTYGLMGTVLARLIARGLGIFINIFAFYRL